MPNGAHGVSRPTTDASQMIGPPGFALSRDRKMPSRGIARALSVGCGVAAPLARPDGSAGTRSPYLRPLANKFRTKNNYMPMI